MDKKNATPTATPTTDTKNSATLNPWAHIEPGATVLYRENKGEGWYECKVVEVSKDRKTLTLKWRDYPLYKPFDVNRLAVGLLCKVD